MPAHDDNEVGARRRATLRVLAVADVVEPQLYNCSVANWLAPIDLLISCGDLPPGYLDFLASVLDTRLMHVLGNHCYVPHDPVTKRCDPASYPGAFNLHGEITEYKGLILAGVEGSPVYNFGPHQHTEQQVAATLLRMVPGLILNKARTGRFLDVLVTHAPPRGIHDNNDVAHKGFSTLLQFIDRFKPTLVLHGHTHRYDPMLPVRTIHGATEIINAYGHVLLDLTRSGERRIPSGPWHVDSPKEVRNGREFPGRGNAPSASRF